MNYEIDLGRNKVIFVPENIQDKIIKDYLNVRYYWVIGLNMMLIGFFIGILVS